MTGRSPAPDRGRGPRDGDAPGGRAPAFRTLFFGSGGFAVPILAALRAVPGVDLIAVVTTPDRPAGRHGRPTPTPVARAATEAGLPLLQPASLRAPEVLDELRSSRPELAVLADYGRIVPAAVLAIPRRGFLNLHPSLLPRHRGATPIAGAILAGDHLTGVTLFEMDEGTDTGPIVAQASMALGPSARADDVEHQAATRAAELIGSALPRWLAGELRASSQDGSAATLTRPFRREDGRLDPTSTALALERHVRALRPWPGTFLETAGGRLAVLAAAVAPSRAADRPGHLVAEADGLALATTEGRLVLSEVQPAGGRAMSGAALRRGRPGLVGSIVTTGPTARRAGGAPRSDALLPSVGSRA